MSFYVLGRKVLISEQKANPKPHRQYTRKPRTPLSTNVPKPKPVVKDPLDVFSCAGDTPEPYKCYYCDFKTDFLVQFNKHVAETRLKPSQYSCQKAAIYICDKCKFETFSRLILLKHAHMKCATNSPATVLILASVKSAQTAYEQIKLLYCKPSMVPLLLQPPITSITCTITRDYYKPKRRIMCEECPFSTLNVASMRDHMIRKHTPVEDINWFHCESCTFKAKVKVDLDRHNFREHVAPENRVWFTCTECKYRGITRSNLNKHYKKVHMSDGKMYKCEKCSHKTKYVAHFKRHMREQHSDDFRWLQCEHCPYKAKQRIHMKLHMVQRHTPVEDIQWYECEKCPYKAKIKASLKIHRLKKHAEQINWFVCEKCGYKVKEKSLLKKHQQKKHSQDD